VSEILWVLSRVRVSDVVDILLVATVLYLLLQLIKGTQAIQLLRGVIIFVFLAVLLGSLLRLTAFSWLIGNAVPALLVAIPVIFQPELRRALERHGAIVVLERNTGLEDYVDTGVRVNARVSSEMLLTIFYPNTALHDGAVILREDRIVAAAVLLPLSNSRVSDRHLGTRHRAALGISEQTDAIAVVVSEETGTISVAHNGRMVRHLDENRLRSILQKLYLTYPQVDLSSWLQQRVRVQPEAEKR
jgi:diadenylate cyclase